jgi:hypothetical protein
MGVLCFRKSALPIMQILYISSLKTVAVPDKMQFLLPLLYGLIIFADIVFILEQRG